MFRKLQFCSIVFGFAAIGFFTPSPAPGQGCPTGLTFCLNDANVTQRFQFSDGADGEVVQWTFTNCTTGFETCGVGTIIKKDNCKIRLVGLNDAYSVDAEVNLCLGQGKAKGKGTSFTTIGGGFQLTDANLGDCPTCPI
jgi:hypothetical protein